MTGQKASFTPKKIMNEKPKNCKYPNCQLCPYTDCRYDGLEYSEIRRQDKHDKELEIVEPEILNRRKSQKKYSKTDKFKEAQKRYLHSDKGKEKTRQYT